jgi:hypothetical protein
VPTIYAANLEWRGHLGMASGEGQFSLRLNFLGIRYSAGSVWKTQVESDMRVSIGATTRSQTHPLKRRTKRRKRRKRRRRKSPAKVRKKFTKVRTKVRTWDEGTQGTQSEKSPAKVYKTTRRFMAGAKAYKV